MPKSNSKKILIITQNKFMSSSTRVLFNAIGYFEYVIVDSLGSALEEIVGDFVDMAIIDLGSEDLETPMAQLFLNEVDKQKLPCIGYGSESELPVGILSGFPHISNPVTSPANADIVCSALGIEIRQEDSPIFRYLKFRARKLRITPVDIFLAKSRAREKLTGPKKPGLFSLVSAFPF